MGQTLTVKVNHPFCLNTASYVIRETVSLCVGSVTSLIVDPRLKELQLSPLKGRFQLPAKLLVRWLVII